MTEDDELVRVLEAGEGTTGEREGKLIVELELRLEETARSLWGVWSVVLFLF